METRLQQQQHATLKQQQQKHSAVMKQQQEQAAAWKQQEQWERQEERKALTAELEKLRRELRSPEEHLPGLSEQELRHLEDSIREERARRQQLQMERMVAQRLAEQLQCAICMEREMDCTFNCGHRTCMYCAESLSVCPFCNGPITNKLRTY